MESGYKRKDVERFTLYSISKGVLEDRENRRELDGEEMDRDPHGMRVADRMRIG
ncbi:hypothetical protein BACI349Y_330013 [Bacillus sp. 349Y]|nr:hypothetical protein BACI349Y_330013 [Bacillus sp. 349Y]